MNICKSINLKGFTLMETLVGVMLIGIGSAALFLGLTQSKLSLESIRVKEKAHQELKEYTEEIKSMIASGVGSFGPEQPGGKRVTLKASPDGNPLIEGRLNREIRKSSNSGDYSIYYYIRTYITWEKTLYRENNSNIPQLDTLEFKSYQVRFSL
tara:strand:- start:1787 stop:2248 length:462 start_codon:yes stop_codon:yes gene_type:complete